MRQLLFMAIAGSLLLTACNKTTNTPPTPPPPPSIPTDGWRLGSTTYKQAYCLRQPSQFLLNCVDATTGTINSFAAFFKAYPTANGNYRIVNFVASPTMKYPGENIGANEIIVTGSIPKNASSDRTFWSTGVEGKDAVVTITNGKLKIEVPEVAVADNGDTMKLSGTMIEN